MNKFEKWWLMIWWMNEERDGWELTYWNWRKPRSDGWAPSTCKWFDLKKKDLFSWLVWLIDWFIALWKKKLHTMIKHNYTLKYMFKRWWAKWTVFN